MVAVGACGSTWARLWVRTTKPGQHRLELRSQDSELCASLELLPPADADGTQSLQYPQDFPGALPLQPLTVYAFRIWRGAESIGEGRFETAPASASQTPEKFAFAVVSCHQPWDVHGNVDSRALKVLEVLDEALQEHDVKRVFLMGDQMYADYPRDCSLFTKQFFAKVAPPGRESILDCTAAEVRALYHRRYRAFWSHAGFQKLLASYSCHAIMDDHELKDNFGSAPEHSQPQWKALREGALDAFQDYQGQLVGARGPHRPASFDYQLSYGDVALYCLDLRSQRHNDGEELQICSPEQLAALETFLASHADKQVVMLVVSVPLMIFPRWTAALGLQITGEDSDIADRWSNPKAEKSCQRLTEILFENQRRHPHQRTVLLGGDIHVGCVVQFEWHEAGVRPMYQLVSSAMSNYTDVLARKLGKLVPQLDSELDGPDGGLWAKVKIVNGLAEAPENPYDGLNIGIVEMTRQANGTLGVQLKLVTHDDSEPPKPRVAFCTPLL
jgi:alkaline phosphatase D